MQAAKNDERGQVLPIIAMLLVALLGLIGLAVDVGRLYVAKAELSRALDSAALAGVLELPDTAAAESRADAYLREHMPGAKATFPVSGANSMRIQGTVSVKLSFMRVLGFDSVDLNAAATAGFGFIKSDTAMIVDATGSMGDPPCNAAQTTSGCPIKEAKDAADGFVDTLITGKNPYAQMAYAPYRGCYNPPRTYASCVPSSMIVGFTGDPATLHAGIANTQAVGGSGTNVCLGLYQAQQMLASGAAQSGSDVVRSVIILTDGDNNYNPVAYGNGAPPVACRPTTDPRGSDGTSGCASPRARERELDTRTVAVADALKAQGVAVYVVAFGTCGTANSTVLSATDCSRIGNTDHDNTADRRLLKCIASSTNGTNDHYFEVPTSTDLPAVFQQIARAVGFRLTE